MGLWSISCFKNLYFPILLHSFSFFFSLSNHPNPVFTNLIRNLKPSLIYKLSLAKLLSNAVLITTSSSSMHFFSFFDVLPSAPTTTGMTLILLMFHILLISRFISWYLSISLLHFFSGCISHKIFNELFLHIVPSLVLLLC